MYKYLLKSLLHNIGVIAVGFILAFFGTKIDLLFRINSFYSILTINIGSLLLVIGFLIRVWATFYFYRYQMKVISLKPQQVLITTGPFHFSRNPLYLGGNVFIFLGSAIMVGSPSAVIITLLGILLTDFMIRREEKQLEKAFGDKWLSYKRRVRRWL